MSRKDDATLFRNIAEGAARAGFVQAWANYMEEQGESLHGELMDQAPATPAAARTWARKLLKTMERMNHMRVKDLYMKAAGHTRTGEGATPNKFGHYMAMEALGHGVSWADDHGDHGLLVPSAEFNMQGPKDIWATVSDREGLAHRG